MSNARYMKLFYKTEVDSGLLALLVSTIADD